MTVVGGEGEQAGELDHLELAGRGEDYLRLQFGGEVVQMHVLVVGYQPHCPLIVQIVQQLNNCLFDRIELLLLEGHIDHKEQSH